MNNETVSYKQETVVPAKTFVNRDASQTRLIAGVSVPHGPLIAAVIEHAQRLSEPYLFNHVMRSWLFAEAIGRCQSQYSALLIAQAHSESGGLAGLDIGSMTRPLYLSFMRLSQPHTDPRLLKMHSELIRPPIGRQCAFPVSTGSVQRSVHKNGRAVGPLALGYKSHRVPPSALC